MSDLRGPAVVQGAYNKSTYFINSEPVVHFI